MSDTIVIVGHPIRKCVEVDFNGEQYLVKFDGFKKENHNEDPFIWNEEFLYSFCHANVALSKKIVNKINDGDNVYFFFVARKDKNMEIMEIDTVIKADKIIEWPKKGKRKVNIIKGKFAPVLSNDEPKKFINIKKNHFPKLSRGNLNEHNNKTLHTCIGDKEKSFLPMLKSNKVYQPYTFNGVDSALILELLKKGHKSAFYPIVEGSLTDGRKSEYRELCRKIKEEVIDRHETDVFKKIKGTMLQEVHDDLRPKK